MVADKPLPMLRAPSIAAGMGERAVALDAFQFEGLPPREPARPPGQGGSGSCASESARIGNYARRASAGIAAETADLKLFDADGLPTQALAHLLDNMASVEIGPLRADPALVEAAVTQLMARIREKAAAAVPPP